MYPLDKLKLKDLTEKIVAMLIPSTAYRVQTISSIKVTNMKIMENHLEIEIPDIIKTSGPGKYRKHFSVLKNSVII